MSRYQDAFKSYLEERGLRVTSQRMAVAARLNETPGHYSTEELYNALKGTEGVGQATVYRTLRLLVESGLALELQFSDGVARFEAKRASGARDHLVCRNCGAVIEIRNEQLGSLQSRLARDYGFRLDDQAVCLTGLCPACQAAPAIPGEPLSQPLPAAP